MAKMTKHAGKGYLGLDRVVFHKGAAEDGTIARWIASPEGKRAAANRARIAKEAQDLIYEAVSLGNLAEADDHRRTWNLIKGLPVSYFVN